MSSDLIQDYLQAFHNSLSDLAKPLVATDIKVLVGNYGLIYVNMGMWSTSVSFYNIPELEKKLTQVSLDINYYIC